MSSSRSRLRLFWRLISFEDGRWDGLETYSAVVVCAGAVETVDGAADVVAHFGRMLASRGL